MEGSEAAGPKALILTCVGLGAWAALCQLQLTSLTACLPPGEGLQQGIPLTPRAHGWGGTVLPECRPHEAVMILGVSSGQWACQWDPPPTGVLGAPVGSFRCEAGLG